MGLYLSPFSEDVDILFSEMSIAIVSDIHLCRTDEPAYAQLLSWMEEVDAEHIVFLGDVFHFWWGNSRSIHPLGRPLFEAIAANSRRVTWVRGNHDFHVGSAEVSLSGMEVVDSLELSFGHIRVFLTHGDQADRTIGYRLLATVLRSRIFEWFMGALGINGSRVVGETLAGHSRDHQYGEEIIEAQLKWASEIITTGDFDVVIAGHTHKGGLTPVRGGLFANSGSFGVGGSWLRLSGDRLSVMSLSSEGHTVEQEWVFKGQTSPASDAG
jgi:UDP-2,3-diacylglucosamine pyrophosphatase LpxH